MSSSKYTAGAAQTGGYPTWKRVRVDTNILGQSSATNYTGRDLAFMGGITVGERGLHGAYDDHSEDASTSAAVVKLRYFKPGVLPAYTAVWWHATDNVILGRCRVVKQDHDQIYKYATVLLAPLAETKVTLFPGTQHDQDEIRIGITQSDVSYDSETQMSESWVSVGIEHTTQLVLRDAEVQLLDGEGSGTVIGFAPEYLLDETGADELWHLSSEVEPTEYTPEETEEMTRNDDAVNVLSRVAFPAYATSGVPYHGTRVTNDVVLKQTVSGKKIPESIPWLVSGVFTTEFKLREETLADCTPVAPVLVCSSDGSYTYQMSPTYSAFRP